MFSKALLISSLVSVAYATVYVTAPVASTTYTAGQSAVVNWQESGTAPLLKDFGLAKISIFVGNAQQQTPLQELSSGLDVSTAMTLSFTPDPKIGPNGNEYFIRFESAKLKDSAGFPVEAFSAKFTLTGMSGAFNSSVQAEIDGQSTAPLAPLVTSGASGATSSSTPSLTSSSASKTPASTSSTTSATAKPSSGAMALKAGWAGIVFGAVVGVTMF